MGRKAKEEEAPAPAPAPQERTLSDIVLKVHGYIIFWISLLFLGESVGISVKPIGLAFTHNDYILTPHSATYLGCTGSMLASGKEKGAVKRTFVMYHMLLTGCFCKNAFTKTAASAYAMWLPMVFSMFTILGFLMMLESDLTPAEQALQAAKVIAEKAERAKAKAAGETKKGK